MPNFGFDKHRAPVLLAVIQNRVSVPGTPVEKGPGELVGTVVKKPFDRKLSDGRAAPRAGASQ